MHALNKIKKMHKKDLKKNSEHHDSPFYDESAEETGSDEEVEGEWNPEDGNGVPTAMFHGLGDACVNPGDIQLDRMMA